MILIISLPPAPAGLHVSKTRGQAPGTQPDPQVHDVSAEAVAELGADMSNQVPTQLQTFMLANADRVIVLGNEAQVAAVPGMRAPIETWVIPDPSDRGIDGIERVRLMRDDIAARVQTLLSELTDQPDR